MKEKNDSTDIAAYNDTVQALKQYRDLAWSAELDARQRGGEQKRHAMERLDLAVGLLRTRHKRGELYYWLLYYTYLSPQQLRNTEEIIETLRLHTRDISFRTYYRRRREAIQALAMVLGKLA